MRKIFVTGIGTGIGKTIVSAVIAEALQADYWKPIQAGLADGTDSETVKNLIRNSKTKIHPEAFRLAMPASPHTAAAAENISIKIKDFQLPHTTNNLVIEGAGGLMVPFNDKELMIDLIPHFHAEVILVVRHYLGSINHTLLSLEALSSRKIPLMGIVFNGEPNEMSEKAILSFFPVPVIGRIKEEINFNTSIVSAYAEKFKPI
ncbi:MAG TPA: dethiobiotin synthase [Bacteroidia bacterium]|nr:dethiobiotin synthase [Bacteroidia bacterium]